MTQSIEPKSDSAMGEAISRHLSEERLSDRVLARLEDLEFLEYLGGRARP